MGYWAPDLSIFCAYFTSLCIYFPTKHITNLILYLLKHSIYHSVMPLLLCKKEKKKTGSGSHNLLIVLFSVGEGG